MNAILFDDETRVNLFPFTHTRPIADILCGLQTMRERWELTLGIKQSSTLTEDYLQAIFPQAIQAENIYVNASIFATALLIEKINNLKTGESLFIDEELISFKTNSSFSTFQDLETAVNVSHKMEIKEPIMKLRQVWDIFSLNEQAIALDFPLITKYKQSKPLPEYVTCLHPEQVFIEESAVLQPCILNPDSGYIYIGKNAEIMEGAIVRGSLGLLENAVLKMGAKVYGATTVGKGSKVGGEVNNMIMFDNSNKGHDGFIGNSVIGEWCNLGADTNSSNLKNNYSEVSIWSESANNNLKTGLQFCGLLMGDHSKCGINTMFNTGTVVGVSANVFGGGFPEKFIPSFSWGGSEEMITYRFDKAIEAANKMMERRKKTLSKEEITVLEYIFKLSESQRK